MNQIEKETQKYFDELSKYHHERDHLNNKNNQKRLEEIVKDIKKYIFHPLLEVGCGCGDSGLLLNPEVAVDYSEGMVKKSKELLPKTTKVLLENVLNLSFENNSFETVVSISMLQNCEFPEKAIKEMVRVAKKNVVIVTNIFEQYKEIISPHRTYHFTKEVLINLVKNYNYKLELIDNNKSSLLVINKV
jgi:ubiquinone/menaquinone biosynthesis C-methylase UbiE